MGIDTYMDKYPDWFGKYFSMLMRNEKTHFYGYLQNPNQHTLVYRIRTAYRFVERPDGTVIGYNCKVKKEGNKLTVIPDEKQITRLHCNLRDTYSVSFKGNQKPNKGRALEWLF